MGELKSSGKSFEISKWEVQHAWEKVKANKGAAGVDGCSLEEFERPGHPLGSDRLGLRLQRIGLKPRQDRSTALFALATELSAAVLARMLGINIKVAVAGNKQHPATGPTTPPTSADATPTDTANEAGIPTVSISDGAIRSEDRRLRCPHGARRPDRHRRQH